MASGGGEGEDDAVYRSLPHGAEFSSSSVGGSSGATYRSLPISHGGLGEEQEDRPSFMAFDTMTTGYPKAYPEEQTVYRSLMVAPPLAPMGSSHAPMGGLALDPLSKPTLFRSAELSCVGGVKSAATKTVSQEITPQPHPFHLQPHCWFIVKGKPKDLVKNMSAALEARSVDFTFKPGKCKWKAFSYDQNRCLDFRVVLFHGDWEPDQFVFDFQRRQGCCMRFHSLLREMRSHFVKLGVVCNEAGVIESAKPSSPRDTGFFPPSLSTLPAPAMTSETLKPIIEMAFSEYAEMREQALLEIANLAQKEDARKVLVEMTGLIEQVVTSAASPDRGLHRHGGVECLLDLCAGTKFFVECESQRQAVSCLLKLCKNGCTEHVANCGGAAVFTSVLKNTTDSRLRSMVSEVGAELQAC